MGIFDKLKNSAIDTVMSAATPLETNRNLSLCGASRKPCRAAGAPGGSAEQSVSDCGADRPGPVRLCRRQKHRSGNAKLAARPAASDGQDISFLNDRFRDGKTYLPFIYFAGAAPENNYTPSLPYTVRVESSHVSGEEPGYMKLFIPCGGADAPRPIKLQASGAATGSGSCGSSTCSPASAPPRPPDPWA